MIKQRPAWQGILNYVILYLVFFLLLNISLAWILSASSQHPFGECCKAAMLGKMDSVVDSALADFLTVTQNLLLTIAGAIMTGFVFQQLANKKPKILLPDKLIIRRRNFDNAIVLNVMVGNKDKEFIYNPTCTITCYYPQEKTTALGEGGKASSPMRGHYVRVDATAVLQNYYRFGFVLTDFPSQFLYDYLQKPEGFNASYVMVMISGMVNYCGQLQQFRIAKPYRLRDIVFGTQEDNRFMATTTNYITGKKRESVQWNIVMHYREISEVQRHEIVQELQSVLRTQAVSTSAKPLNACCPRKNRKPRAPFCKHKV